MRAIILAAGRGSRMRELTDSKPKCLVELCGVPLLRYQVGALRAAGVEDIGIVVGYAREALLPYVRELGLEAFENARWADSNMIHSLECAREWLLSCSSCVVSYSDIFYESSLVRDLAQVEADMAIGYDVNWRTLWEARFSNPLEDAESFVVEHGYLREIGRRVESLDSIQGQYMGLLRFSAAGLRRLFEYAQAFDVKIDTTSLLAYALRQGEQIACVPYSGIWGECDNKNDVSLYERLYPRLNLMK